MSFAPVARLCRRIAGRRLQGHRMSGRIGARQASRAAVFLREWSGCPGAMRFAKREMQLALGLWAILTVVAGVAGPFGTHDALTLPARLVYWAAVTGVAIGVYHLLARGAARLLRPPASRQTRFWRACAHDLVYALVLGGWIWGLNAVLFSGWGGILAYVWLVGIVLLVSMMIGAGIALLRPAAPRADVADVAGDPAARFLRHLPVERRAPLVRIEAQDHYLLVVTRAGQATILMRMSDAEALLPPDLGLRVHRSHWVAHDAVRGRLRDGDRVLIETADGARLPVSRGQRKAAQAAGLI